MYSESGRRGFQKQVVDEVADAFLRNLGIGQLQGYMLEEWRAGTFNVDAIAADLAFVRQRGFGEVSLLFSIYYWNY